MGLDSQMRRGTSEATEPSTWRPSVWPYLSTCTTVFMSWLNIP